MGTSYGFGLHRRRARYVLGCCAGMMIAGCGEGEVSSGSNPPDGGTSWADGQIGRTEDATTRPDTGEPTVFPDPDYDPADFFEVDPLEGAGPVEQLLEEQLRSSTAHPQWLRSRQRLLFSMSIARSKTEPSYRPYAFDPQVESYAQIIPNLMTLASVLPNPEHGGEVAWCKSFEAHGRFVCWISPKKARDELIEVFDPFGPSPTSASLATDIHTADRTRGSRMKWLNDVVATERGTLLFTTFKARHMRNHGAIVELDEHPEAPLRHVFLGTEDASGPIALAMAGDGQTVYFTTRGSDEPESGALWRSAIDDRSELGEPELVIGNLTSPDGLAIDIASNLYVGSLNKVLVFSHAGELLGELVVREEVERRLRVTGLAFGGSDRKSLFITYGIRIQSGFQPHGTHHGGLFRISMPIPGR
ncbi:MAG: SMP-30/gluconolactonase/LRE family protein [Myxococcota bacterium]